MKLLLLGASGQVGWELARAFAGTADITAPDRAVADLSEPGSLRRLVQAAQPDLIVNAAAYTDVEKAETECAAAQRINADAPGELAAAAREAGAVLVHYSTDYVFDGRKGAAYREADATCPLNAYGRSKRAGEEAVAAAGGEFLVFRIGWVYGARRRNFLTTIRRLAAERGRVRVVADQVGCPTWCRAVAEATLAAVRAGVDSGRRRLRVLPGLYHMVCGGTASWHAFARAALPPAVPVEPIASTEFPSAVVRPAYSVLDTGRLAATFGINMPAWEDALRACLAEPEVKEERTT